MALFAAGAPVNGRWEAPASCTATDSSGGNTHSCDYWLQWFNQVSWSIGGTAPVAFDSGLTYKFTAPTFGASTPFTLTGGVSSPENWPTGVYIDNAGTISFDRYLIGSGTGIQWQSSTGANFSATVTTGGNTYATTFYKQITETYKATPYSPTTFTASLTFPIKGIYLGTGASTICTITVPSSPGAGVSYSCSGYSDYDAAAAFPMSSGSWKYRSGSTLTYTDTSEGLTHTVDYIQGYLLKQSRGLDDPLHFDRSASKLDSFDYSRRPGHRFYDSRRLDWDFQRLDFDDLRISDYAAGLPIRQ